MRVDTNVSIRLSSDAGPTPVTVANSVTDGVHRMWLILGETPNTISVFPGRRWQHNAREQLDNLEQFGREIVEACQAERERQGWAS